MGGMVYAHPMKVVCGGGLRCYALVRMSADPSVCPSHGFVSRTIRRRRQSYGQYVIATQKYAIPKRL
jgi:hypothetical protein